MTTRTFLRHTRARGAGGQVLHMAEFLPGYEATSWTGIGAPKNTPADIIDKLNREINAGLADPKTKARSGASSSRSLAAGALRAARRVGLVHQHEEANHE